MKRIDEIRRDIASNDRRIKAGNEEITKCGSSNFGRKHKKDLQTHILKIYADSVNLQKELEHEQKKEWVLSGCEDL